MASLRDLGLSEYEARSYRALLRTGPTTAKELSRASDVPMGRIYDVLNSLEQHNLVRSQAASRPKKYVAVEPDAALDRLLTDKKRELNRKADQYEAVVEELSTELDAGEPTDEQFWTAVVGPEETAELLVERLAVASDHIAMVVGSPSMQFDLGRVSQEVVAELETALDRDVSVSVLMSPALVSDLPERIGQRYAEHLADRPSFTVRTAEAVSGAFLLIDDVEVCVEVPNPLESDEALGMIDLKDREFAADVREVFEPRWQDAEPFSLDIEV